MKKFKFIVLVCLLVLAVVALTGCEKKEEVVDYSTYIGQYEGNDPWGNKMSVTFRNLQGSALDWTYGDAIVSEKDDDIRMFAESINEIENGVVTFNISGETEANDVKYSFEFKGKMTLKEDKVILEYEDGGLNAIEPAGAGSAYQVGLLDKKDRTVTLERYKESE